MLINRTRFTSQNQWKVGRNQYIHPTQKECPENVYENVRKLSRYFKNCHENVQKIYLFCCPEFFACPVFFIHENFRTNSRQINPTNSGHEKFQTNSGQINQTNSGHKIFRTYSGQIKQTNSGHEKIPDKFWTK